MRQIDTGDDVRYLGQWYRVVGPDKNNRYDLYKGKDLFFTQVPYADLEAGEPLAPPAIGLKFDSNKPDYTYVTKELMDAVSRAMGYGAQIYSRDNFKLFTKDDEKRFEAALLRHMIAYTNGELLDSESGLSHLDHVGSCLNILLWLRGNK